MAGALIAVWKKLIQPISTEIKETREDLTRQIEDEIQERQDQDTALRKNIFAVRTIAQTYVGKVDTLERNREVDQVKNDAQQKERGRLEIRVESIEKKFDSIHERLLSIEAFNKHRILPILERLESNDGK